jgi:ABC-2 type transport system ATP-binding protein
MICGLVKPTSGSVRVGGYNIWSERDRAMHQIGVVLEGTRNIHWSLSAWDNLIYFGNLKGVWGKKLRMRAENLLRELGLWDRRRDLARSLSRGMQQKLAVGCALIANPSVILLDEPTLGLDVQAARAIKDLVEQLAHEQNKTVVLTTHQMALAQSLCERVAIISKGQIIADKSVEELLDVLSQEYYQIEVEGHLPADIVLNFVNLTAEEEKGNTVLSGPIADQDELYHIHNQLHDLGFSLLSASRVEPDLEEVFVHMIDGDSKGDQA